MLNDFNNYNFSGGSSEYISTVPWRVINVSYVMGYPMNISTQPPVYAQRELELQIKNCKTQSRK